MLNFKFAFPDLFLLLASLTTGLSTTHSPIERENGSILLLR